MRTPLDIRLDMFFEKFPQIFGFADVIEGELCDIVAGASVALHVLRTRHHLQGFLHDIGDFFVFLIVIAETNGDLSTIRIGTADEFIEFPVKLRFNAVQGF